MRGCGIVPKRNTYYDRCIEKVSLNFYTRYFLASGVIGILQNVMLYFHAEVGCQGEVEGVSFHHCRETAEYLLARIKSGSCC